MKAFHKRLGGLCSQLHIPIMCVCREAGNDCYYQDRNDVPHSVPDMSCHTDYDYACLLGVDPIQQVGIHQLLAQSPHQQDERE